MQTLRRASIDLGTNTCLLLVGEWDSRQKAVTEVCADFSTIVRLGEGVDQGRRLNPQAMERTLLCLKQYAAKVQAFGVASSEVVCVATSHARDAQNGASFFERVREQTGFRFRVLSGEEEARTTFLGGLLPGMKPESSVVIDIGGGSTELVSARGGKSLDIGSVRFTERYLTSDPVTDDEFWRCQDAVDGALEVMSPWREACPASCELVGVAGTVTNLASWHLQSSVYEPQKIDVLTLTRGDIHRMVEELKWRTIAERKQLTGIEPERADVLLAGALILWRVMEVLRFPSLRSSTRGLRYGVLDAGS